MKIMKKVLSMLFMTTMFVTIIQYLFLLSKGNTSYVDSL